MYKQHLTNNLIPYWKNMKDLNGGFYGEQTVTNEVVKSSPKGGIYSSRILWFFSNCYMQSKDESLVEYITHAYDFIVNNLYDAQNKGMAWACDSNGSRIDNTKHTYNNAFAIYAIANYYKIFPSENTKKILFELYDSIEKFKLPNGFYKEQFDECYNEVENRKLCEVLEYAPYTMNTVLHILEAYTDLYEATREEKVRQSLIELINLFRDTIYIKDKKQLGVFFDENAKVVGDHYSYGHDIEASWLIDRALTVGEIEDKAMTDINTEIAYAVYDIAYKNDSVLNECVNGVVDTDRVWWIQAESMVGFDNAYKKTKDEKFKTAVKSIWNYVKQNILMYGEWVWSLDENGKDTGKEYVAGMWKGPYHNGRAMLFID